MAAIGPTPFILTTADRIISESDSISALDGDSQEFALTKRRLYALAMASGGPKPFWWNTGISTTRMDQQVTRVQKGLAQYGPITKFVWSPGIFDVVGSGQLIGTVDDVIATTWLGGFNLMCLLVAGIYQIPMYICGPHFIGEKWPSGKNAIPSQDASLDALDAGMITIVKRFPTLITYRSARADMYTALEPTYNQAQLAAGPFTRPDGGTDHFNPGGRGIVEGLHAQDMQLQVATSYTVTPTTYSGLTPPSPASIGVDYDPANVNVANGANVLTWVNSNLANFAGANLVTTPATKPVFANPGDGTKINGAPAVNFGGAAWIKSGAFTGGAKAQPLMTAFLFKPASFGTSMIWIDGLVDGGAGVQEPYIATITGTGVVEIHSGTAFDTTVGISAAQWHSIIVYWSGHNNPNGDSYVVVDGRVNPLGAAGTVGVTGRVIGASVGAGLIANGLVGRVTEWYSSLGALPRWQDVQGWLTAKYGVTPQ